MVLRFFKWTFKVTLFVTFALSVVFAVFVHLTSPFSDLPDHTFLKKYYPSVSSRVFLQDGTKLAEYSCEKRYFIPIDKIPAGLINAFVAAEDKHFFQHMGVDFSGIVRSIIKNIENIGTGKRPQGASTITQQVARIFLIKTNKISYVRKLKEAILSYRIESTLSKRQILELYLNQVYMGIGTYGVAAAAKAYFNKSLNELSIAECSYLASLAKGANNYHPVKHKAKALQRRNWVIRRQLEDGYISESEARAAIQEDLVMAKDTELQYDVHAEYFAEEIRKYLIQKFPMDSLNREGLVIRATLEPKFQKCAYEALRNGLEEVDRRFGWRGPIGHINIHSPRPDVVAVLQRAVKPKGGEEFLAAVVTSCSSRSISILTELNELGRVSAGDVEWVGKRITSGDVVLVKKIKDASKNSNKSQNKGVDSASNAVSTFAIKQVPKVQGAIIVIEVNTGRILAMQGGYSFSGSEFNRAIQAVRQCGSAFKPFVYLTALENGFTPNTVIDSSSVEVDMGEAGGIWRPKNYRNVEIDKITLRRALERSVNTATVRLAQEVGLKQIAKIAEQFGIFNKMPQMLSYALGAGETTLLRLTTAYAMLGNGGKRITPTLVDYVLDRNGHVLYKNDHRIVDNSVRYDAELPPKLNDDREQILDARSVYQMTSLLEGVVQRGSAASARSLGLPIAGKTGTSNSSRDTWFIGYTPDIAVGVFVGFDDQMRNLGKKANGSNTALPIFLEFVQKSKKYITPTPFRIPKGIKLRRIDLETGGIPGDVPGTTIMEAFKEEDEEGNAANIAFNSIGNALEGSSSSDTSSIGGGEEKEEEKEVARGGEGDEAFVEKLETRNNEKGENDGKEWEKEQGEGGSTYDKEEVSQASDAKANDIIGAASIKSEKLTTLAPIIPVISEPLDTDGTNNEGNKDLQHSNGNSLSKSQYSSKENGNKENKSNLIVTPFSGIY